MTTRHRGRPPRKTYPGGVEAVRGIDFEVAPGEVFGLLGPNGAGKSTTIGMLTTTIAPTGGTRARSPASTWRASRSRRARLSSVVFQDAVVDRASPGGATSSCTPACGASTRREAQARIEELADAFGLAELVDRPVGTYSGGQRRRLEIARALVSRPRVLFLDEPTVGLDPRIRDELLDVIAGLRDRDETTILLTTHYLDEAERLCDRRRDHARGGDRRPRHAGALLAGLGSEILELRVDGDAARRARGAPRAAGSPAATRSRSARRSPSHCTTAPRATRSRAIEQPARRRGRRPRADPRRRVPAADRRPARRGRLNHEKGEPMTAISQTNSHYPSPASPATAARAHSRPSRGGASALTARTPRELSSRC